MALTTVTRARIRISGQLLNDNRVQASSYSALLAPIRNISIPLKPAICARANEREREHARRRFHVDTQRCSNTGMPHKARDSRLAAVRVCGAAFASCLSLKLSLFSFQRP